MGLKGREECNELGKRERKSDEQIYRWRERKKNNEKEREIETDSRNTKTE